MSVASEKWVLRLGSTGAALRFRYMFLRVLLVGWVLLVLIVGLPPWPRPGWFYAPETIVIAVLLVVIVPLAIIGAQLWTRRRLVAEVLRNARLPDMPISDRSLGSVAGYDNWMGRVGGLAREA